MARIPDDVIARLKAEVSVQRLVEGVGVELRRQGKDLVGRCPFHQDGTPSLVITPAKNLWHCLGACAAGGGPVDWVMAAQGVSFRHAVELLLQESPALSTLASTSPRSAGGPVKRSTARKLEPIAAPDAADVELIGRVVEHYAQALAGAGDAQELLHRRKLAHPEAVETFRVGFADRSLGYRLPSAQTKPGAQLRSRLRTLGVLRASGHEHFRGCLTIPVLDEQGHVGEVYGRRVQSVDKRTAGSAHLYLPGPHRGVFNIGVFAGVDELIICESLIDALTLWCAGFRHVTAAYGADGWTAEHQAAVLEHGITRVVIAYDRDPAGDAGAKSLAGQLMPAGVECFRVELPHGADVNDVAVDATDPTDVLGRYIRRAAWMGTGPAPTPSAVTPAEPGPFPAAALDPATLAPPADEPAEDVSPRVSGPGCPGPGGRTAGCVAGPAPVDTAAGRAGERSGAGAGDRAAPLAGPWPGEGHQLRSAPRQPPRRGDRRRRCRASLPCRHVGSLLGARQSRVRRRGRRGARGRGRGGQGRPGPGAARGRGPCGGGDHADAGPARPEVTVTAEGRAAALTLLRRRPHGNGSCRCTATRNGCSNPWRW